MAILIKTNTRTVVLSTVCFSLAVLLTTQADATDRQAAKFAREAMQSNQSEMALAEYGVRRAQSAELREYCTHLQQDHRQAAERLTPIASRLGVAQNQDLSAKTQKLLDKYAELEADEFDKEFAEDVLREHQKDIRMYQRAAQNLDHPELRQYARDTLPKLRQHFSHGRQVATVVGVEEATLAALSESEVTPMGGAMIDTDVVVIGSREDALHYVNDIPETSQGAGAQKLMQSNEYFRDNRR